LVVAPSVVALVALVAYRTVARSGIALPPSQLATHYYYSAVTQ